MSEFSCLNIYKVKNQNGLKNALYDFYGATDNGKGGTMTKKEVRNMIQDIPPFYPITMAIVDESFECGRMHLEFLDLEDEAHRSYMD